jgi:hypothetical protein
MPRIPSGFIPLRTLNKKCRMHFLFPLRATCPIDLINTDFMTLRTSGERNSIFNYLMSQDQRFALLKIIQGTEFGNHWAASQSASQPLILAEITICSQLYDKRIHLACKHPRKTILTTHKRHPLNSIEQSSSWDANSYSASKEIFRLLWNTKLLYRVYNSSPRVPILSQLNPVSLLACQK